MGGGQEKQGKKMDEEPEGFLHLEARGDAQPRCCGVHGRGCRRCLSPAEWVHLDLRNCHCDKRIEAFEGPQFKSLSVKDALLRFSFHRDETN